MHVHRRHLFLHPEQEPAAAAAAAAETDANSGGQLSEEDRHRKTTNLLDEYLSVGDLKEATLCVQELESDAGFGGLVKSFFLFLYDRTKEKDAENTEKLMVHLLEEKIVSGDDFKVCSNKRASAHDRHVIPAMLILQPLSTFMRTYRRASSLSSPSSKTSPWTTRMRQSSPVSPWLAC